MAVPAGYRMFSAMVVAHSCGSCGTKPICRRSQARSMLRVSILSIRKAPACGSYSPTSRSSSVDLPLPVSPTIPRNSPGRTMKETSATPAPLVRSERSPPGIQRPLPRRPLRASASARPTARASGSTRRLRAHTPPRYAPCFPARSAGAAWMHRRAAPAPRMQSVRRPTGGLRK